MGIAGGSFLVAADLKINGTSYPWYKIDVTLANYTAASTIEADIPTVVDGVERDFPAELQAAPDQLVPVSVSIGSAASGAPTLVQVESAFTDEMTEKFPMNLTELVARSHAALFQDSQVADPAPKSRRGDQIVQTFFTEKGLPVTIPKPSPTFSGKPGYTQGEWLRAYRARTQWDEMHHAAKHDGYELVVHNGKGYYGPRLTSAPTITLARGKDICSSDIKHSGRRSHDITVRHVGYHARSKTLASVSYGTKKPTASSLARNYLRLERNADLSQLQARAQSAWLELVQREFVATLVCYPDPPLLSLIAQVGAQFNIQLTGAKPSNNVLYYVRQVVLNITGGDSTDPECKVTITASNILPQAGGGSFL